MDDQGVGTDHVHGTPHVVDGVLSQLRGADVAVQRGVGRDAPEAAAGAVENPGRKRDPLRAHAQSDAQRLRGLRQHGVDAGRVQVATGH